MADEKKVKKMKSYKQGKQCQKCGFRMAEHFNRFTCGKCRYTEFKDKKEDNR